MSTKNDEIRIRITLFLKTVNLSIKSMADNAGIPYQTLRGAFAGKTMLREDMIALISSYGVDINWLLTGEGEMWRKGEAGAGSAQAVGVGAADKSALNVQNTGGGGALQFAQEQARNCHGFLLEERGKNTALGLEVAEQKDLLRKATRENSRYRGIIRGLRKRITGLNGGSRLVESRLQQEIDAANRLD